MNELRFYTAVHSIDTGEKRRATFYLMNTTVNRNRWGVTGKALEEALTTIIGKPLGCGPEYQTDRHYPDPLRVGSFTETQKPDSYALGTAEITDAEAWARLTTGTWGPISVVIHSYKESCSHCHKDLTHIDDPFNHRCIREGDAHLQVESFVFDRADFIDAPAYPQAGYINQATAHTQIPLQLPAQLYTEGSPSQSTQRQAAGSPGTDPNPMEEERRKKLETQKLQERITQLEQQLTQETKAKEEAEEKLGQLNAARHAENVDATLQARAEAGLARDPDAERERLNEYGEEFLAQLKADAEKIIEAQSRHPAAPKAKNAPGGTDLEAAMEDTRERLFGHRRET